MKLIRTHPTKPDWREETTVINLGRAVSLVMGKYEFGKGVDKDSLVDHFLKGIPFKPIESEFTYELI